MNTINLSLEIRLWVDTQSETVFIENMDYSDERGYASLVKKTVKTMTDPVTIVRGNEGSTLRIADGKLFLEVTEGNWYRILNIPDGEALRVISMYNIIDGIIKGSPVVAFLTANPMEITFIDQGTEDYKVGLAELNRRNLCKIMKKTKQVIPGHRYETEQYTLIFLGTLTRTIKKMKGALYSGEKALTGATDPCYIYAANVDTSGFKTIEDLILGTELSKNLEVASGKIFLSSSIKPGVECGEVLEDNLSAGDYRKLLLQKVATENCFPALAFLGMTDGKSIGMDAQGFFDMMSGILRKFYLKYYGRSGSVYRMKGTDVDLATVAKRIFGEGIFGGAACPMNTNTIYAIYENLGITGIRRYIDSKLTEFLEEVKKLQKTGTFEDVLNPEYEEFFVSNSTPWGGTTKYIVNGSEEEKTIRSLSEPIRGMLTGIVSEIINSGGKAFCGPGSYTRYNSGRDGANPIYEYTYRVRIKDINDYYGGEIPAEIKEGLIRDKIRDFYICSRITKFN